jgi:hypothetical protein
MKIMDVLISLFDGYEPSLMLPHEAIMAWRPTDPRRYDSRREKCVEYLRQNNLYILDGKFTPTKASHTDITVVFNRARQQMGEKLIQVAK